MTITGILRRLGPLGRRFAWNREFQGGARFSGHRSQLLISILERYCAGARIVELACGDGSLAQRLGAIDFRSYQGFDISSVAIEAARKSSLPRQVFGVGDMESWQPAADFDVLIIEEAIYYLGVPQWQALLTRAFARMPQNGVVIVSIHSLAKFPKLISQLKEYSSVVEEFAEGDRRHLVLAQRR